MGEAKRRGAYEERKAAAIAKKLNRAADERQAIIDENLADLQTDKYDDKENKDATHTK
jgi:hypothetical protein